MALSCIVRETGKAKATKLGALLTQGVRSTKEKFQPKFYVLEVSGLGACMISKQANLILTGMHEVFRTIHIKIGPKTYEIYKQGGR